MYIYIYICVCVFVLFMNISPDQSTIFAATRLLGEGLGDVASALSIAALAAPGQILRVHPDDGLPQRNARAVGKFWKFLS